MRDSTTRDEGIPNWRKWIEDELRRSKRKKPTVRVGSFRAAGHRCFWIVSPGRKDVRHGPIGRTPIDPYFRDLYEDMMRGWR